MVSEIDLTERELEILRRLATGASNKQIAQALKISPNTVKVHLRNIFEKIGVLSRTEAAVYALRSGLIPTESPAAVPSEGSLPGNLPASVTRPATNKRGRLTVIISSAGVLLAISAILLWQFLAGATAKAPAQPSLPARWQAETRLPDARAAMAAAVYEGQLYLIGGLSPQGVTASVLLFQPDSGAWEARAPMPAALGYIQAALLGEKLYVPGGCDAAGLPTRQLEIYDPRLDHWEAGAPLPQAECGYALAVMEGHLYLFGGWDGKTALAGTWIYDPLGESWSRGSPMPGAASYASAQAVEGQIFVIGGYDGAHALAANRVYYPSRDQAGETAWEEKTSLPDGRYGMGSASLAGSIYLAGGVGEANRSAAPLEYLPRTDQWLPFEAPPEPAGAFPALLPLDTRLHLLGGRSSGGLGVSHQSYQAIYTILFPVVR
jgi:DNA-binding CsgD family transcriptional regulator/N-acetylneuraminic acid mutarotase